MNKLSDDWKDLSDVVLYGYGTVGKSCLGKIKNDFNVSFIIDRNAEALSKLTDGIPVYKPDDGIPRAKGHKIVVMTGGRAYLDIAEFLKSAGLVEFKDFCGIEYLITWWYWDVKDMNCVMELHSALTMDCTLKCKNCNMFVPFYKDKVSYEIDRIKDEIGRLFMYVDYLFCFTMLGGEPFLYEGIGELVRYIGDVYKDRIGTIKIITNGTVVPKPDVVDILSRYKVFVSISDYTGCVSYQKKLEEVEKTFDRSGVNYIVTRQDKWLAFGFPETPARIGKGECAAHMRECSPIFHGYNDKKVFYCHVSWSAEKIGRYVLQEKDFVDLETLPLSSRHVIAEHCLGEIRDGYVSFCQLCGGCGRDNRNEVVPGEQLGKGKN